MRLLLSLLLIGLIALAGSRAMQSRWRVPPVVRRLFDSGLVFLMLGVALGPAGVGMINDRILEQTGPIVFFCLGWIGFLFGVHLEWKRLRRLTARMWAATLSESLLTLVMVLVASWLFFSRWCPTCEGSEAQKWAALLTLAACAAGTAPASVFALNGRPWFRGDIAQAIRVSAALDDLPGLILFGVMFALLPGDLISAAGVFSGPAWILLSILIGVVLGLMMKSLTIMATDTQVQLVVVMGLIAFGAGAAAFIHLSPIFVGAVAGVTLANTTGRKETVFELLASSEKTIYVLFLVLVGCHWAPAAEHLLALTLLYLGVRAAGKVLGGIVGASLIGVQQPRQRFGGLAMLGQGGLAIAMALNYAWTYEAPISPTVMTVLIVGVLINELIGPGLAFIPFGPPKTPGGRR
ncbi:MAG: cation:proton antiporter [Candidatus Lernaella stagnicola]|nr:cation:proton antiporter [Candidatus Lernaella stagnicola]